MKEIFDDIWKFSGDGIIVIPTNGFVKNNGSAIMGRGLALQAREKFPDLPFQLGKKLESDGNHVFYFPIFGIITFPVKINWMDQAAISLIGQSLEELETLLIKTFDIFNTLDNIKIYIPRVGCGNGLLNWGDVKPLIEKHLSQFGDHVIICYRKENLGKI